MRPYRFKYLRAEDVGEALAMLRDNGPDSKLVAGGQSLVPLMNMRFVRPSVLIDIWRIDELRFMRRAESSILIGANTRHDDLVHGRLDPSIAEAFPIFKVVASQIGHLPIRTRGTIGGSIAHADPAAEWPLMAVCLDADFAIAGKQGTRWIGAQDFFRGFLSTALADDELLLQIRIDQPDRIAFEEFAIRKGDFALSSAIADLTVDEGGCRQARIAVSGGGVVPMRLPHVEEALVEQTLSPAVLETIERITTEVVEPLGDVHASADYRRALCGVMVKRAVERAWQAPDGATTA